jgi:hypothetical protein
MASLLAPLWLETLERLAARAAHPVRNALNGVALNAEVVRSRAGREGPASALAPFASAAAAQVEHLSAGLGALLSFLRPEHPPGDAAAIAQRVAVVLREPSGGGTVVEVEAPASAPVAGSSDVARLVIVRTLLDCVPREARARCVIAHDDAIFLSLLGDSVFDAPWDVPLADLARVSGIDRTHTPSGVMVRLPRASRAPGTR